MGQQRFRYAFILLFLVFAQMTQAATIVDFEDVSVPADSALTATADNQEPLVSHGVQFNRTWNAEFNCCPSAWAASNRTDGTTTGYTNAYSAIANGDLGGGVDGSANFAVANNQSRGSALVTFGSPVAVSGAYFTNVTYGFHAIVGGDDGPGAGFVKGPFADGDWFRLDVIGLDDTGVESGRVPIYLSDYRNGAQVALDDWTWSDLSTLGFVSGLEFEMTSTDTGDFGMNTPAYFAIDNLTFVVPEPTGSLAILVAAWCVNAIRRRRTRSYGA